MIKISVDGMIIIVSGNKNSQTDHQPFVSKFL